MGLTVDQHAIGETCLADLVVPSEFITRNAPGTHLALNPSDLFALRDRPSPLFDTPYSVPDSPLLPSVPPMTTRAMRALRYDTLREAHTAFSPLFSSHSFPPLRKKLTANMPAHDHFNMILVYN